MNQKKWTSKEKLRIVLEVIKGQVPLGELCVRNGVSQAQYYKWRDRLLKEGEKAFEYGGVSANEERLRQENLRLRKMIGDLTIELKKTEDDIASFL
ncbi:MAG TPA: transposase [Candidatus Merdousia gallistercoris]|nr:transposase [Candidatus Merdousia gallistercoris]